MVVPFFDSQEKLDHALHYWKEYNFVRSYLNVDEVIQSLATDDRLVEARPNHASRWVLCPSKAPGIKEAMFHTAAVWRWNSHLETGNFVPTGAVAETRVAESRVQWEINNLCQFSYAVDTHFDTSIWDAQKAFEDFVCKMDAFNRTGKKCRPWQDSAAPTSAYVMSSQIFTRRPGGSGRKNIDVPYTLHPWIEEAVKKDPNYMPNPARPKMFELSKGALVAIKDCATPYLAKGDVVWISFAVEFIVGASAWSTSFIPYEIVRVGSASLDLLGGAQNPGVQDTTPQQGLEAGLTIQMSEDFPMHATPRVASAFGPTALPISNSGETSPPVTTMSDPELRERASTPQDREMSDSSLSTMSPASTQMEQNAEVHVGHVAVSATNGGKPDILIRENGKDQSTQQLSAVGADENAMRGQVSNAPAARGQKRKAEEQLLPANAEVNLKGAGGPGTRTQTRERRITGKAPLREATNRA